jgi:hypothetical protein
MADRPYKSSPPWGHVAEWLRSGLQNRLLRFNSGRGLHSNMLNFQQLLSFLICSANATCYRIANRHPDSLTPSLGRSWARWTR